MARSKVHRLGPDCLVEGCEGKPLAKEMCQMHYYRFRSHGTTDLPPRPAGRKWKSTQGYVKIFHEGKQTHEHRVVMEQTLGRKLLPGENVHHINGLKADNRPENLELWVTSQPSGQRPEDLLTWAYNIIERYGP